MVRKLLSALVLVVSCGNNNNDDPVCGNEVIEDGEQCDDGNTTPGDGCDQDCQLEAPPANCGDGTVQANEGEQCDDGNTTPGDGCDDFCQTEVAVCGDGTVQFPEECDDGNLNDADGCEADCTLPACVNGIVDPGEFCVAAQAVFAVGNNPITLTSADLNNDGLQDLVVGNFNNGNSSGDLSFLFNQSTGGFADQQRFGLTLDPIGMVTFDKELDNDDDVFVLEGLAQSFTLVQNNGQQVSEVGLGFGGFFPLSVTVGRFNDGDEEDIATANPPGGNVNVHISQNAGFFSTTNIGGFQTPQTITAGDFDGDGDSDIAAGSALGTVDVILQQQNGNFGAIVSSPNQTEPTNMAAADINGDGFLDVVSTHQNSAEVSILPGLNNGQFAARSVLSSEAPKGLALSDLDNDQDIDIVVTNAQSASIQVFLNEGDGTFATPISLAVGIAPFAVIAEDLNQDTLPDLAVVCAGADSVSVIFSTP